MKAGASFDDRWTNRIQSDVEVYSLKQRNCAYHAFNVSVKTMDRLFNMKPEFEFVGKNVQRYPIHLFLEKALTRILYVVFIVFTDGMDFKNFDPEGNLQYFE